MGLIPPPPPPLSFVIGSQCRVGGNFVPIKPHTAVMGAGLQPDICFRAPKWQWGCGIMRIWGCGVMGSWDHEDMG